MIQSQIDDLSTKIASQFSDLREIPYRLSAVFIHRGSSSAGHYWIYIYDFKARMWRKYNDEHVTQVRHTSEIFDPPTGPRPPTPYFVVYVQDEHKEALVDPVCRNVVYPAPEVSQAHAAAADDWVPIGLDDGMMKTPPVSMQSTMVHSGPTGEVPWDDSQHVNVAQW